MDAKRVMLLNMPISTRERPSIGLSLLKAALLRDGIACDVKYFNLRFAELIGEAYHDQIVDSISYPLLGEWIFAEDLFGDRTPAPEKYFTDVFDPGMAFSTVAETHITHQRDEILRIREKVGPFFDECMLAADWNEYAIVGFASVFQQNVASLAFAKRLKERYPHLVIVFGGANCDGEMGPAVHRLFPFVDYVFVGEADLNFPGFVKNVLEESRSGISPASFGVSMVKPCCPRSPAPRSRTWIPCPIPFSMNMSPRSRNMILKRWTRTCSWRPRAAAGGARSRTAPSAVPTGR